MSDGMLVKLDQRSIDDISDQLAAYLVVELPHRWNKRGIHDINATGSKLLGKILRENREAIGLTQNGLARLSGLHPTTINKIETGNRGLGMQTFARLYVALNTVSRANVLQGDALLKDLLGYYLEPVIKQH